MAFIDPPNEIESLEFYNWLYDWINYLDTSFGSFDIEKVQRPEKQPGKYYRYFFDLQNYMTNINLITYYSDPPKPNNNEGDFLNWIIGFKDYVDIILSGYIGVILSAEGFWEVWPFNETSGSTALATLDSDKNVTYAGGYTLNDDTFLDGEPTALFGNAGRINNFKNVSAISSEWSGFQGWMSIWFKVKTDVSADPNTHLLLDWRSGTQLIIIRKDSSASVWRFFYQNTAAQNFTFNLNTIGGWNHFYVGWESLSATTSENKLVMMWNGVELINTTNRLYVDGSLSTTTLSNVLDTTDAEGHVSYLAFGQTYQDGTLGKTLYYSALNNYLEAVYGAEAGKEIWKLTENSGTTANAEISGTLNGTYVGSVTVGGGTFLNSETCVRTHGGATANYVELDPSGNLSSTWDWTQGWVSLWLKPKATQSSKYVMTFYQNTPSAHSIVAYLDNGGLGDGRVRVTVNGCATYVDNNPTDYTIDEWYHLYISWQDNSVTGGGKLYIMNNGVVRYDSTHATSSTATGLLYAHLGTYDGTGVSYHSNCEFAYMAYGSKFSKYNGKLLYLEGLTVL